MIDWQLVLLNIRASGMPMSRVAERIGMDDYTLRRYARGEMNNPRWSQALATLDLHHERCPARHHLDRIAA